MLQQGLKSSTTVSYQVEVLQVCDIWLYIHVRAERLPLHEVSCVASVKQVLRGRTAP